MVNDTIGGLKAEAWLESWALEGDGKTVLLYNQACAKACDYDAFVALTVTQRRERSNRRYPDVF